MGYINDTCVFIGKINSSEKIIDTARHCKQMGKKFCVTDIVMDELKPGLKVKEDDAEISNNTLRAIKFGAGAGIIDSIKVRGDNGKYKDNFNKIRKRYYDHLKDPAFVKKALETGEISQESFDNKSYRYKDYGECSCIAVAMEEPDKYTIISDDKGKVFLKPKIKLFERFKKTHGVSALTYDEWACSTGFVNLGKTLKA